MGHTFNVGDIVLFAEQLKCKVESQDGFNADGVPCYRIGNKGYLTGGSAILGGTRVNEKQIRLYPE